MSSLLDILLGCYICFFPCWVAFENSWYPLKASGLSLTVCLMNLLICFLLLLIRDICVRWLLSATSWERKWLRLLPPWFLVCEWCWFKADLLWPNEGRLRIWEPLPWPSLIPIWSESLLVKCVVAGPIPFVICDWLPLCYSTELPFQFLVPSSWMKLTELKPWLPPTRGFGFARIPLTL